MDPQESVGTEPFAFGGQIAGGFEIVRGTVEHNGPMSDFQEENISDIYQFPDIISSERQFDWHVFPVVLLYCFQELPVAKDRGVVFIDFDFNGNVEQIVPSLAANPFKAKNDYVCHCEYHQMSVDSS